MINSNTYWDDKFEKEKDSSQRSDQTNFFAKLALESIPQWCHEDIRQNACTICDVGCAEGGGTAILHQAFPNCKVAGIDFSKVAIDRAINAYQDISFAVEDITKFQETYDIIFSSNVLEHFYYTRKIFHKLLKQSNRYLILLLPFREFYKIAEHATAFDFQSFPLKAENHTLCYFKIVPMVGEQTQFWVGEQILVIYKNDNYLLPYDMTLENLYNGYIEERTKIIRDFDEKLAGQGDLYKELEEKYRQEGLQREAMYNEKSEMERKLNQEHQEIQMRLAQAEHEKQALLAQAENEKQALIAKTEYEKQALQAQAENEKQTLLAKAEYEKQTLLVKGEYEKQALLAKAEDEKKTLLAKAENEKQTLLAKAENEKQTLLAKAENEKQTLLAKAEDEKQTLKDEYHAKEEQQNALAEQKDAENQSSIRNALNGILVTQQSRAYKWSLAMRRLLNQFFRGNKEDRKDFVRWVWSKLIHKDNGSKWLCEFDFLEETKRQIRRIDGVVPFVCRSRQEFFVDVSNKMPVKTRRQIFIFASVPFYDVGGGQRSAQMTKAFHELGYEVCYIYGFDSTESKREEMFIPAVKHLHIDQYSVADMAGVIRKDAVLIFEIPYFKFEPYLDFALKYGFDAIYEHIDNWDTSLGCLFYDEAVFAKFVRKATLVTVTARLLGEKVREVWERDYLYSANAVNATLFEPLKSYEKPTDLIEGKKTLLYFGSLWGEWFDWDKITYIAKHCDCAINLIGDYQPILERVKSMPANVHFLGLKKQTDLPAYLHYSDIALLPFKNCEIGKYVSPLKIFEYIAMRKPVISTPLDDISGYPNVFVSDSNEDWAWAVEKDWEIEDSSTFISQNNWFARCNALLANLENLHQKKPKISIVVLNHNNMKVIFRCVSSLLDFNSRYNCEVVVVDNDSTDGSYEELQKRFGEKIVLIKNEKNGCSSGRNLGVKNATGDLIFFLDSDQWVISETYLDNALDILEREYHIGAVGWNAGWFNPGRYDGPIVDYLPNRGMDDPRLLYRTDIAYLATSGMLMRKDLFYEIGGFDEFYDPTCFEDTDISLKIRDAGYELAYCPYMEIMHLPHQTTASGSKRHTELMNRNGTYFVGKWKERNAKLLEFYL